MSVEQRMWYFSIFSKDKFDGLPTPFLGLRARLSQAWAAPPVLIAVLFLLKLQLLRSTIRGFLDTAENGTLQLCIAANSAAAEMAQLPRSSALMVNKMIDQSISHSLKGLLFVLSTIVTALEQILLFVIELSIGTWACLTVSFVNVAANEALNATESVISFANTTVQRAAAGIEESLGELSHIINGATGLIGTIETFITGSEKQISKVNLTINGLENMHIPASINPKLEALRNDTPTYSDVKDTLESVVSIPFNLVKKQIMSTNLTFSSKAVQPPPVRANQVCDLSNISHAYISIAKAADIAINVFTAVVCVAIVVLIFYNIETEAKKWDRFSDAATRFAPSGYPENSKLLEYHNLRSISTATSGTFTRIGLKIAGWFQPGEHPLLAWYVQYVTYRPALNALLGGICMLVLALFEFIVVYVLAQQAQKLSTAITTAGNSTAAAAKQDLSLWQATTNQQIGEFQNQINDQVLGWVSTSTLTVNTTLARFMTEMNGDIDKVFGNTPFHSPLKVVVDCLIGNKVEKLEKGLTWVHNKAHVSLPNVSVVNDLTQMNGTAMRAQSRVSTAIPFVANTLYSQVQSEAIVGGVFVGLWILFALGAGIYVSLQEQKPPFDPNEKSPEAPKYRETQVFEGPRRVPRINASTNVPKRWHSEVDLEYYES